MSSNRRGKDSALIADARHPRHRDIRTSKKSGQTTVEIDPTMTTPQRIVAAIAELGYTATSTAL